MSDEPTSTPQNDCDNCPTCVKKRLKLQRIVSRFVEVDKKAEKLYDAYRANLKHINIQKEKIKVAERVSAKFEMSLKANVEDMKFLGDCVKELYDEIDGDGTFEYEPETKAKRIANLTLPPPPGT